MKQKYAGGRELLLRTLNIFVHADERRFSIEVQKPKPFKVFVYFTGKGENIWDHITHTNPDFIDDRQNGDVACDSYHKFREDVQLVKSMGVRNNHAIALVHQLLIDFEVNLLVRLI